MAFDTTHGRACSGALGFLLLVLPLACSNGAHHASDSFDDTAQGGGKPLSFEYDLPSDQFPESGTFDPVAREFFVGSLKKGNVLRVEADGTTSVFTDGTGEAKRITLGMKLDAENRRLWLCSILNEGKKPGQVWVFDVDVPELVQDIELGDLVEGASCNDLAIDRQGRAYVTDRENPNIYRIDLDAGQMEVWATDKLLAPATLGIGMNGAAFTPDGSALLVTQYLPASILRISTSDPTDITEVSLDGDSFSGGIKLANGADGIVFYDSDLYVAFGDNVMRLRPDDASWSSATVSAQKLGTGFTAVTVAEGDLYAIRGQAVAFQFGLKPALPFDIVRVDVGAF